MQVGQWSGFVTDKIGMQFGVPPMKIAQLKSDLDFFISSRTVNFRDLAWVSGFINSLFVAVDLIASLFIYYPSWLGLYISYFCSSIEGVAFLVS